MTDFQYQLDNNNIEINDWVSFIVSVNSKLSAFGAWGACSVKCGAGTQTRTRTCVAGNSCGAPCSGALSESRACGTAIGMLNYIKKIIEFIMPTRVGLELQRPRALETLSAYLSVLVPPVYYLFQCSSDNALLGSWIQSLIMEACWL